jgi:hypothetical protein
MVHALEVEGNANPVARRRTPVIVEERLGHGGRLTAAPPRSIAAER